MKEQAYKNRFNIVITGLPENENQSPYSVAYRFFKNQLKLKKLSIEVAFRKGQVPPKDSTYVRPLVVKFTYLLDRNLVWRRRNNIQQIQGQQTAKIQADLPKQLREDVGTLYRMVKAAAATKDYNTATVRDYSINLQGKQYLPGQLETLPFPIRPSTLAVKQSDQALVFFSKFSFLSNHHPSTFTSQDTVFYNVEHFLAVRKAELSQQLDLEIDS